MADDNAVVRPAKINPYPGAKKITPVATGFNTPVASQLFVKITSDNLSSAAIFSYVLVDEDNDSVGNGTVVINGDDYVNWTGDNNTPYTFVASKIGVTLV